MHFIVDSMFPRSLVFLLKKLGHDAVHAKQLGLKGAEDRLIWREAERIGATVISKDSDFPPFARISLRAKLIHYTGGNTTSLDLLAKFESKLPSVVELLEKGNRIAEFT